MKGIDKTNKRQNVFNVLSCFFAICSLGLLDVWLRVVTRWINAYSIYAIAPNLFTLLWSSALVLMISAIAPGKIGGVIYGVVYFAFLIYAIVQYGAYLILGKFLFLSDFLYAGEGFDYVVYVKNFITPGLIVQVFLLVCIGIGSVVMFSKRKRYAGIEKMRIWSLVAAILCLIGIANVPRLYGETSGTDEWNDFYDAANEYRRFVNANFDLELTGMYQYLVRDMQVQAQRQNKKISTADIETIDDFFANMPDHKPNEMTGIFEGKNLIVVMMESMDDWLVNENDTPVIHYMMNHGINFANMYTPRYSSGYTFNTEFAFNTCLYPYTNGNAAYSLANNSFTCSLANRLSRQKGYIVNSFHEGLSTFYNRGEMHEAFGYNKYHSYGEYLDAKVPVLDDTFLIKSDQLYEQVTYGRPFYSYIITYGGHLPYNTEDDMHSRYALNVYPQYDVEKDREVSILRAKVRLTDDMFKGLLMRLEEDGILENTVIVGFADHYAYGINESRLREVSHQAGSDILEKTPAFIFCTSYDDAIKVDKTMQTTDLAPTLMNLFGVDVPTEIMGRDIFDENYSGMAIFPNNTWITDKAFMKEGQLIMKSEACESDYIEEMQRYVQRVYQVNDLILDTDYYQHRKH